jgi:hypothetical protein
MLERVPGRAIIKLRRQRSMRYWLPLGVLVWA